MFYGWDPRKAAENLKKHGVAFTEAASVFLDPLALTYPDPDHSQGEMRFITIGRSTDGRALFVAHADLEEDGIRIISARRATKREVHGYNENL